MALNVTQARRDDVHVKWVTGLILALSLCILQLQVQMAWVLMPGPGQALPRRAWSKQLPLRRKPDLVLFSRQLPLTQLKVSLYLGVFIQRVCVCVCCVCRGVGIKFHGGGCSMKNSSWSSSVGHIYFATPANLIATACPLALYTCCALKGFLCSIFKHQYIIVKLIVIF